MSEVSPTSLELPNIDVRLKLSSLWAVYMFVFTYTDYYKMFMPGEIAAMTVGKLEGTLLTQSSLLVYAVITILPALMIFLSLVLAPKVNRWLNIIVGVLYVGIGVASIVGHSWAFWVFYCALLVLTAVIVVVYSWRWPAAAPMVDG